MATVNKNFRIKNGLVVEGSTATINGNNILAENAADSYILNLVGGATLVKSVDSIFTVDGSGKLTINANTFDSYGSASAAQTAAEGYADSAITIALNSFGTQTTQDIADAIATAESYADSLAVNYDPAGAAATAQSNAEDYADGLISTEVTNRNNAISSAISDEVSDRNSAISTAITNLNLATTYDALGAASQALTDANAYTDQEISGLVNSAPAMLDTLGELATALQNNPDIITNLQDVAAGKQGTLTTGNGIVIDNDLIYIPSAIGGGLNVTPSIVEIDRTTVDTWYDAAGAASTAQTAAASDATTKANAAEQNAKDYADDLASNYDPAGAAAAAQTAAESYADAAINNGNSSATPTYAGINFGWVAKDFANYQWIGNGSETVVATWPTSYATAKIIVHLRNGIHSQASEIMVARDSSNNIAISEYGIVTTNGSLGDITASVNGNNIELKVTPTHSNGTDVAVRGSSLIWAD